MENSKSENQPQPKILIVYHSQSGRTLSMAEYVLKGVQTETSEVRFLHAHNATLDDLIWCDGVIFGTPENFGMFSGMIKDFFERTYHKAREMELHKPYCLFVTCRSSGEGAERDISKVTTGIGMKRALAPVIANANPLETTDFEKAQELGATFAAGVGIQIF
ncbi:MAG: flavodoxin [Flavobacteriaceae bacterium]|nr:MAG: flavodoxin [Flavobacteriaceae bacterium]